jgi:hypothetical protein
VSDPWNDEGFGAENDWSEESLETDLEVESLFDPVELEDDDGYGDDEE